ncbi:hypothetical protein ABKA04_005302 [Annulohypoxylon sp. FPYF3050]
MDDPDREHRQAARIVRIAKDVGVEQVVSSTSLGVSLYGVEGHLAGVLDPGTALYSFVKVTKAVEETVLKGGFDSCTFLRPGYFMANFLEPMIESYPEILIKGTWSTVFKADTRLGLIDHDDIAKFAVAAFQDKERFNGNAIGLVSEFLTPQETLDRLGEAMGRSGLKAIFLSDKEISALPAGSFDNPYVKGDKCLEHMAQLVDMEEIAADQIKPKIMSLTPEAVLSQLKAASAAYAEKKPGSREQLLNLGYALVSSVELPSEAIQRMGWAEPARAAHCRIAIELGIFDYLKESGQAGVTAKDLAMKTGANEVLIKRTMKHLAATNVVAEAGDDKYTATRLSDAFTEPRYRDGIIYTYDVAGPSFRGLPEYLKSIKYTLPTKLTDGPFQAAHKTQLPFFAWIDQNPPYLEKFNSYMAAYRAGKPSWVDPGFYPISERLTKGFDAVNDGVMLVDVGGGLGHDLRDLKEKHPSLPGSLILQDRPEVISTVSGGAFLPTSHDFFTPQPVKNARAYYLHSVLHDWGDDDCVKILEQLKPAMKPGYSRLLINEIIVPDRNPTWPVTSMDQLVFVLGAMGERSEKNWEGILNRAGFKITHIYNYEMGSESLIEADLA